MALDALRHLFLFLRGAGKPLEIRSMRRSLLRDPSDISSRLDIVRVLIDMALDPADFVREPSLLEDIALISSFLAAAARFLLLFSTRRFSSRLFRFCHDFLSKVG